MSEFADIFFDFDDEAVEEQDELTGTSALVFLVDVRNPMLKVDNGMEVEPAVLSFQVNFILFVRVLKSLVLFSAYGGGSGILFLPRLNAFAL